MELKEIQKILKNKAKNRAKRDGTKFVPTAKKVYGVKVPVLNEIVKRIKEPDFKLVEKLWESGYLEERILATKILREISKKNQKKV